MSSVVFVLVCSLAGSFWSLRTCQVPDKVSYCLLCFLAGRSGRTTWEESTTSIMKEEPHSGSDPQHCRTRFCMSQQVTLFYIWCVPDDWLCVFDATETVTSKFREDRTITRTQRFPSLRADKFQTTMKTPHKSLQR